MAVYDTGQGLLITQNDIAAAFRLTPERVRIIAPTSNANYLGKREPAIYGSTTVDEWNAMLRRHVSYGIRRTSSRMGVAAKVAR